MVEMHVQALLLLRDEFEINEVLVQPTINFPISEKMFVIKQINKQKDYF